MRYQPSFLLEPIAVRISIGECQHPSVVLLFPFGVHTTPEDDTFPFKACIGSKQCPRPRMHLSIRLSLLGWNELGFSPAEYARAVPKEFVADLVLCCRRCKPMRRELERPDVGIERCLSGRLLRIGTTEHVHKIVPPMAGAEWDESCTLAWMWPWGQRVRGKVDVMPSQRVWLLSLGRRAKKAEIVDNARERGRLFGNADRVKRCVDIRSSYCGRGRWRENCPGSGVEVVEPRLFFHGQIRVPKRG